MKIKFIEMLIKKKFLGGEVYGGRTLFHIFIQELQEKLFRGKGTRKFIHNISRRWSH